MKETVVNEEARKSKEDSLAACVEEHRKQIVNRNFVKREGLLRYSYNLTSHIAGNLLACFKSCSFFSSFTGCCTQEHKTFWDCYTTQRV